MTHTPATSGALVELADEMKRFEEMEDDPAYTVVGAWADRLLTAAAARPADGWLPIESAPKDGTHVIVSNGTAVGEAWYSEDDEGWWWANTAPTDYFDGAVWNPINWQPLPTPPASDTAASVQQGEGS